MVLARASISRRLLVGVAAGTLVLAACGGGESGPSPAETGEALTTAGYDLGDETVRPESLVETNLFPDLVVDDVGRGKKVNLKNVVPNDKPVLLWMWAPH